MVYQSFLIKYAEIGTKGKNRYLFEDALIKQIKNALRRVEAVSYTHLDVYKRQAILWEKWLLQTMM